MEPDYIIPLTPITKKNSQQIIQVHGRPMIIPSAKYRQYEKDCKAFLKPTEEPINYPVCIKALFYMPTHRRCDLTNLLEALHDVLTKWKVIEDDNCKIIKSVDGSRVLYDKQNPRTEIYITKMKGEEE